MSKSMAVAIVALFFSLTGWGVAAKVALEPDAAGDLHELCEAVGEIQETYSSGTARARFSNKPSRSNPFERGNSFKPGSSPYWFTDLRHSSCSY